MRFIKHFLLRLAITVFVLAVPLSAGTGAPFAGQMVQGISDPRSITGLAAWYDVSDLSSIVKDGSNRVQLIADKSGNSAVNVLALNGVAGNYASSPDSAAVSVTGDIDLRGYISLVDWTPASVNQVIAKWTATGNQRSYQLALNATGVLRFVYSTDGSVGTIVTSLCTAICPFSDLSQGWVRATRSASTGDVVFYTSTDGATWTQLGATISTAPGSIFDGTAIIEMGSSGVGTSELLFGSILRAQIYNGINGTLAFDANFSTFSKLATSGTESSSNAATVTINTTGRYGARICGARDLVNMTASEQPIYSVGADGKALLTFDGSNDSLKAAAFALAQPEWVNFVGSQVTWFSGDSIIDGNAAESGLFYQNGTTPQVRLFAGTQGTVNSAWPVATRAAISAVINNTSPSLRVNNGTAVGGTVGAANMNGLTLGARGGVTDFSNITVNELAVYSVAPTTAQQTAWYLYARRKWAF
jgi:hypothetical protein